MIRVASLRKSSFSAARRSARQGARELEHARASAKLMRPAQKTVKDQHHPEEANGRLAAESEEPLLPRFLDCQETIHGHILQNLLDPAGPADFHLLNTRIFSQAKMHARITGRRIAHRRSDFIPLRTSILGGDVNLRSNTHAIAFRSH